ncbi:MAG TPA: hypothetical protein VF622_00930, partial [Segetibacter sp.]
METSELILSEAIKQVLSASIHEELDSLLKCFESRSIDEFLNGEKSDEISNIDLQIHELYNNTFHLGTKTKKQRIIETAQIIFTEKEYLLKALKDTDLKAALIFLSVNCYLS